ncbi:hypothetical protein [uncultured Nocardioides sp.]|uniref:hypothetical protein n=1 Tax=uncultured Nocardioides sp. TaxID=198441 RepID=UPI0026182931|nr:hypothetical protein [uncultured Nocardioides sp.]
MPMELPEIERRIGQNSNDIVSIYDLLSTMNGTLAKHSIQLSNLTNRVEAHDERFDGIDGRLDGIDGRLDGIDARLDRIDGRLDGHDDRFDRIDTNIAEILRRLPG